MGLFVFFLDNKAACLTQGFSEIKLEPPGELSNAENESKVWDNLLNPSLFEYLGVWGLGV